jgi:hypothetical protein
MLRPMLSLWMCNFFAIMLSDFFQRLSFLDVIILRRYNSWMLLFLLFRYSIFLDIIIFVMLSFLLLILGYFHFCYNFILPFLDVITLLLNFLFSFLMLSFSWLFHNISPPFKFCWKHETHSWIRDEQESNFWLEWYIKSGSTGSLINGQRKGGDLRSFDMRNYRIWYFM